MPVCRVIGPAGAQDGEDRAQELTADRHESIHLVLASSGALVEIGPIGSSVAAFAELGHAPSYNAASRTYFDQRTTAGKNKMNTRVAIGRKLVCTIFAILRTGRPYDPAYRHSTALSLSAVA